MTSSGDGPPATVPPPEKVAELVKSLALVMQRASMTELDIAVGSLSVRLRRPEQAPACVHPDSSAAPDDESVSSASTHHVITAPMIGTFYASPTPGAQPFIKQGDDVSSGQTIGIIEAMKIMNEISADRTGYVAEVLVGNGQPVEYGSPLFSLSLDRGDRL